MLNQFERDGAAAAANAQTSRIAALVAIGSLRENAAATSEPILQQILGAAANFLEGLPVSIDVDLTQKQTFTAKNPFGVAYKFSADGTGDVKLAGSPS